MKPIRTLALAAAVSALALGAYASTTVDARFDGTFTSFNVSIQGTEVVGNLTVNSATVNASAFDMFGSNPSPDDGSVPSSVIGKFVAWCLDIGAYLNQGTGTYTVNPETVFASSYDVDTTAVRRYFDANFSASIHLDATQAAAFQIGLWATIYDTVNAPVEFGYTSPNEAFTLLVDGFVAAGTNYGGNRIWTLTYLESTDDQRYQNLVTATPIPLPATGLLMLSVMGLGGIGVMARRRRDKAA